MSEEIDKDLDLENEEFEDFESEDEEVNKQVQTLSAQKKHFREKFEKEKQLREELEAKLQAAPKKEETPDNSRLDVVEQKVELRMDGYSAEEIKQMETFAKGSGKSLLEAKDDPFVQAAIKNIRAEKRVEDAIPSSSPQAKVYKGKTYEEVIKDPEASKEDKQKAFEASMKSK